MEYLSETQKRSSNNDEDLYVTSPKQKRSRSSGNDVTKYLRDETEKNFELRAEDSKVQRAAMEKKRKKQEGPQNPMEMLIQSSQQQMNAMLLLVKKISEELSYTEKFQQTFLIAFY